MSLDVYLEAVRPTEVYHSNITHNLCRMAKEAGIEDALWEPIEHGLTTAGQLVPILREGLTKMRMRPDHYTQFSAENGWGTYEQFVPWIERYLAACEANPDAKVSVSR